MEEVLEGLEAQQAYRSSSLDELTSAQDTPLADRLGGADAELDRVEYRESLIPLLNQLSDRDRAIVVMRFFGGQTQTQIAEVIGISQMHVSRLLGRSPSSCLNWASFTLWHVIARSHRGAQSGNHVHGERRRVDAGLGIAD